MNILILLASLASIAHAAPEKPISWREISNDDRIQVFRGEVPGSDVVAFKAIGIIDAPVSKVGSVLVDITREKEWLPNLAEARIVRQIGPHERIDYTHIKTPVVIKDRDFVIDAKAEVDQATGSLILSMTSVEDPTTPPTNKVRGKVLASSYTLQPIDGGAKTRLEFRAHVDPEGSVPKWIVNLFSTGFPRETLVALRRQSQRADIAIHPEISRIFGESR